MSLFVSTNGADVVIKDLGITITHPTTNKNLTEQFTAEIIRNSKDLTNAITSGQLIWRKTSGGPAQPASAYDPDYALIYDLNVITSSDLSISAVTVTGTPSLTIENSLRSNNLLSYKSKHADALFLTVSSGGSTTLTANSNSEIYISGGSVSGYFIVLPQASTLQIGREFIISNISSSNVEIRLNSGIPLCLLHPNSSKRIVILNNTGSDGSWSVNYSPASATYLESIAIPFYRNGTGIANGTYLYFFGTLTSNTSPAYIPFQSRIIGISLSTTNAATSGYEILRVTNLTTPIATISVPASGILNLSDLNIPLNSGDGICIRKSSGTSNNPSGIIYIGP